MFPSFEIKKLFVQAWNFIKKETIAQVFSCEFCEIFNRTSLVAASEYFKTNSQNSGTQDSKMNLRGF